ncbi:MAG: response regulator [Deltaproteobacteria bacterium]|nr:response regulator [Deltaproteobacteria bacterium]MBW1793616.1 response regulator [Deltaproteobacteria bacterium]MBW2329996.1 response regulator [Deltaproteobacteria bacterium]
MNLALKTADTAIPYDPRKILIVDDEPRMCDSLKALLSSEGYEIHIYNSGKEAIKHLEKNRVDLVLLDIVMPEIDGHRVMDYINSQDTETLVIFITGYASVESAIEALRGRAYDYLKKPFEYEELLKAVKNALDEKALRSERKRVEEALRKARDELELRVKEETAELTRTNELLHQEIIGRKRAGDQIRRLSHELLVAQESERQRISRELHDVLGQELSALKIGLDTFIDNQAEVPPGTRQRLAELSKTVRGTIMSVRDLAYNLRPPSLDQLGLGQTILQCCEEFSAKSEVKVDFFATGIDKSTLDFNTKINLYRLIQEGLNNVKKHADATEVTIRLVASFPDIILRIEDNGKGFDIQNRLASALDEKRMGLRSMEERVALLGGKMRIESRAMQGTKILIEIPIKDKKSGQKENRSDC